MNKNILKKRICDVSLEKRKNYYVIYSFAFVALFLGAFGIFWYYGKAPIWDSDAISQHYPNFIYMNNWMGDIVRNFIETGSVQIQQWDPTIGLGQDVFNVVSLRPSSLLAAFFEKENIITYIWLTIFVRFYLVGIAFSEYCFYINADKYATLVSTLLYTFSSYALVYGTKHYMFVDMLLFLPILCIGLEKIINKQKPWIFIFGVFISAWSYFYMLYIVAVVVFAYYLVRYFTKKNKTLKEFFATIFKCGLYGIAGLLMAAASLLPTLLLSAESSRYGETIERNYTNFWHYSREFYIDFFTHVFSAKYMYLGLVLGFSGLLGITVLYVFLQKKRKEIKISICILTILLGMPLASYLMNAFSGYTLRWSFCLHFVLGVMLAIFLPEIFKMSSEKLMKILGIVGIYILTLLVFQFTGVKINVDGLFSIGLFIGLVFVFHINGGLYSRKLGKGLILGAIFLEICIKSVGLYSPYGENYIDEFYDSATVENEVDMLSAKAVKYIEDESVYRVDEVDAGFFESVYNRNYGQRTETNGLSTFYSYSTGNLKKYISDLGIKQQPTPFCVLGMTHRTALNTLNSVKYLTTFDAECTNIPFGYEYKEEVELKDSYGGLKTAYVYENKYALPYMIVHDGYIKEEEFNKLNAVEKETAMMQTVVLKEQTDFSKEDVENDSLILLEKESILEQIKEKYEESGDIIITERGISTTRDGVSITIDLPVIENSEVYVWFDDLEYIPMVPTLYKDSLLGSNSNVLSQKQFDDKYRFWDIPSSARMVFDNKETFYLNDEYAQYYSGSSEAVANLGYYETGKNQVEIYFSTTGEYNFSDIQVMAYSMETYKNRVSELQNDLVKDITIDGNKITGFVELEQDRLVCVNIPKSNGWKAYINGKETKIYTANGMYMGLLVPAGNNDIELVYETPGLKEGGILSAISIIIFVIMVVIDKKWKLKSKRIKAESL